ncbi:MAG: hypothetical protein AAFO79_04975 [Pseudomonadota bacterium]
MKGILLTGLVTVLGAHAVLQGGDPTPGRPASPGIAAVNGTVPVLSVRKLDGRVSLVVGCTAAGVTTDQSVHVTRIGRAWCGSAGCQATLQHAAELQCAELNEASAPENDAP